MNDYKIIDGKIHTIACEINVVHHCNLSCRSCGHLSPIANRYLISPENVHDDLSVLSKYFHTDYIRLLGGEPLLHPELIEIIRIVKNLAISDRIRINTNGVLLWKMHDDLWKLVDEIHVSVKPGKEMAQEKLAICIEKAELYSTKLDLFYFDRFREGYSEIGTKDKALIQRIYNSCWLAHHWHCHTVHDGHFYKCSQSFILPGLLKKDELKHQQLDGLNIADSNHFLEDLLSFLKSTRPLNSCRYCLGTVGKLYRLDQISRKEWRNFQNHSTEELVDLNYLQRVELNHLEDPMCIGSHISY